MIAVYDRMEEARGALVRNAQQTYAEAEGRVAEILAAVRERGDEAVREYTMQFDGAAPEAIELSQEAWDLALKALDEGFVRVLQRAAENIRAYHACQVQQGYVCTPREGVVLGRRVLPLQRVGLYIPGGTASYPSSVLMNAIPAVLAGVPEICMATPPDAQGGIRPELLAAARIAGVHRIFLMGGAQAVAAMAYGTQSVPKVDKIVGPGNRYVAIAKRQVYGQCDIDMIAGPSEICVVADETAQARTVAADLLSQAEHDPLSRAVLLTPCRRLIEEVQAELARQLDTLSRAEIARAALGGQSALIYTDSVQEAVEFANELAPEHLELCVREPFALLGSVQNAGSVFLGHSVPEALGDYMAGPNHTLPTGGTARFSSPLSVEDFTKKLSFTYYTPQALQREKEDVMAFAMREGLQAHARSVGSRFEEQEAKE